VARLINRAMVMHPHSEIGDPNLDPSPDRSRFRNSFFKLVAAPDFYTWHSP
jgi:hypothetical protein